MAQALGYVTKMDDGAFEGVLSMLSFKAKIKILPNAKKDSDRQPDFRIFTGNGTEVGGMWDGISVTTGKPKQSITLSHPEFGSRRIYANLGRAAGQGEDNVFAILWNPED